MTLKLTLDALIQGEGDKPSLELFPPPLSISLPVSPQGVSHCVWKEKWSNPAASQIEAASSYVLLLREGKEKGNEKHNETDD